MTTVTSVVSVTTSDAAPTAAPHRVSRLASWNIATVAVRATATGLIRKLRVVFDSSARNAGVLVFDRGAVCGLDRCGAPGVMTMGAASPLDVTFNMNAVGLAGPDGDHVVSVHALADSPEGWSA